MAAPTLSTMIDPTKQAEYPIVLGERLANSDTSRLINVNYNYKTKAATSQQRSTISRSSQSSDLYDLSVTDKAPSADHTLTYSYKGSEDPVTERDLVLVFDPDRKVFVLEPVSTKLNFNLRSAPGKSEKQVLEQYEQLRIVEGEEHTTSGDDRNTVTTSEDEGPADESNPYDFRHFLPKEGAENVKPASGHSTPEPVSTSRTNTPITIATKPTTRPMPRPKKQANPLRETKRPAKPPASANPPKQVEPPAQQSTRADPPEPTSHRDSISDAGTTSQQSVQSPDSNIIVDGDLIIDMGSPPPARAFKVDPSFSRPIIHRPMAPRMTVPATRKWEISDFHPQQDIPSLRQPLLRLLMVMIWTTKIYSPQRWKLHSKKVPAKKKRAASNTVMLHRGTMWPATTRARSARRSKIYRSI
jgi:RNA polymerase II transcription elongation factor.